MYPAPHIHEHEHLATANCEPQPEPHCEQWHGHHKAHGRVQCAVLSTPTSHLWLKVSPCVSFHVIHACAPVCCSLSVSPHPSFYFLVLFLFQLYLMSNSAPDEFSIKDPLCNSSLGSMVTLELCHTPHRCSNEMCLRFEGSNEATAWIAP